VIIAAFAPLEDDVPASRRIALHNGQTLEDAVDDLDAGLDRPLLAPATQAQR
jgi:hypothetical protein